MTMMTQLRDRMNRRAAYSRLKREIETMPLDVALDLDIDRADARGIARRAVYEG